MPSTLPPPTYSKNAASPAKKSAANTSSSPTSSRKRKATSSATISVSDPLFTAAVSQARVIRRAVLSQCHALHGLKSVSFRPARSGVEEPAVAVTLPRKNAACSLARTSTRIRGRFSPSVNPLVLCHKLPLKAFRHQDDISSSSLVPSTRRDPATQIASRSKPQHARLAPVLQNMSVPSLNGSPPSEAHHDAPGNRLLVLPALPRRQGPHAQQAAWRAQETHSNRLPRS